MNMSNRLTSASISSTLNLSNVLNVQQLEIRNQYDGHVLATTLLPALLQQGYELEDLRREALGDVTIQPATNVEKLMKKFDLEAERFFLSQVTEAEMTAAHTLLTAMGVTPTSKKGTPIEYVPSVSKGFNHTPTVMSGPRALRMMSGSLPEAIRSYLKTFI